MITQAEYLADPCRAASIPYWKAKAISVPEGMLILHDEDYSKRIWTPWLRKSSRRCELCC